MLRRIYLFLILYAIAPIAFAQSPSDSLALARMERQALRLYDESIGVNLHIYEGAQFVEFQGQQDKYPYFKTYDWSDGSIHYDGQWYDRIPLVYNIVTDEVAVLTPTGHAVQLRKRKVRDFSYLGSHIVNIEDTPGLKESGFYEILYDGDIQLLARRKKVYMEKVTYDGAYYEFLNRDYYVILKEGKYYYVKGKHSALNVFYDHKKELHKYLSTNHISFGASRERALILLAEYYNTLMK